MRARPTAHAVALRPAGPGNASSFPVGRQGERGLMPAAKPHRTA
ncbi:hypothetical protein [Rhodococcus sp. T7]|nr:hypothetical protein [Rhodococcus sp. T7]KAF0959151.1 hypothetical protein MLGJGCBP_07847 [Rhodococcus sp. T7]